MKHQQDTLVLRSTVTLVEKEKRDVGKKDTEKIASKQNEA